MVKCPLCGCDMAPLHQEYTDIRGQRFELYGCNSACEEHSLSGGFYRPAPLCDATVRYQPLPPLGRE